jgi:hypothetical protein
MALVLLGIFIYIARKQFDEGRKTPSESAPKALSSKQ